MHKVLTEKLTDAKYSSEMTKDIADTIRAKVKGDAVVPSRFMPI